MSEKGFEGIAWLSATAWSGIAKEVAVRFPRETGGVLLGYWVHEPPPQKPGGPVASITGPEVVITNFLGPGPLAIHGLDSFVPDHAFQDREIAKVYEKSSRQVTYLGDWHSHPRGTAALSWKDRRTLRRIAHSDTARAPIPLMFVVAAEKLTESVLWYTDRRSISRLSRFSNALPLWNLTIKPFEDTKPAKGVSRPS